MTLEIEVDEDLLESTSGDDSSTEESTSTEEESAASAESQAETEESTAGEESTEGSVPAKGRSSKLQKLLDKYKGDEDKLAEAVYESYNSGSKLRKELDEYKALVKATLQAKSEPEVKVEEHPDYKGLEEQLGALDEERRAIASERKSIADEVNKANKDHAKLEGKYEDADDLDKPRLKHLMSLEERKLKDLEKDWNATFRNERKLTFEQRELEGKKKSLKAHLEADRANSRNLQARTQANQGQFAEEFKSAIDSAADELNLKDDESREYLHNIIKSEAIAFLRSLPEDSEGIDPEKFVAERAKAFAKVHGLAKKKVFTEKNKAVLEAAGVDKEKKNPPATSRLPVNASGQPVLPKGRMTAEQSLQWRKKILGA